MGGRKVVCKIDVMVPPLDSTFAVFAAIAGAVLSFVVIFVVMPKIDNACELPMPNLPSYWLGHAWQFLNIKTLLSTNMQWFRELGDVFQIWIVHRQVVVTANPEDVVHILGKPAIFARPPAQVALFNDLQHDNLQTMPRELHRMHRKRLREAFNPSTVRSFAGVVSRSASNLVKRLDDLCDRPVNFTPHLADTTFAVLLEAVLGSRMDCDQRAKFAAASHSLLRELLIEYFTYPLRRIFAFTGVRRQLWSRHRAVLAFAEQLVNTRTKETSMEREKRAYDVMDVIMELDPTNRTRQIGNAAIFAIAGFESSSEAIAWAVYEICGAPEVARKIRIELDQVLGDKADLCYDDVQNLHFLRKAWKETLRLHPASGFMLRVAQKDAVLPGSRVHIPAGVQVGVLIAGAQRNPKYIADPDQFRPQRWDGHIPPAAFVPFSCGPERCPGQALADYECVAILAAIFRRFDVQLACERDDIVGISDWTERARGPAPSTPTGDTSWTLPVRFTRRSR